MNRISEIAALAASRLNVAIESFEHSESRATTFIGFRRGEVWATIEVPDLFVMQSRLPVLMLEQQMRRALDAREFEQQLIAAMNAVEPVPDLPYSHDLDDTTPLWMRRFPSHRGIRDGDLTAEEAAVHDAVSLEPPEVDYINRAWGDLECVD